MCLGLAPLRWDMDSIEILGVRVDDATYAELLVQVDAYVDSGEPHQVVTLNPEMLVAACDDAAFRRMLNDADLNVADGVGLKLAARWLGHPLRERVTGSDGIYRLATHCARRGYRPFFLGAAPGVAEIVARRLSALNPGLEVAGAFAGSPRKEDQDDVEDEAGPVDPPRQVVDETQAFVCFAHHGLRSLLDVPHDSAHVHE